MFLPVALGLFGIFPGPDLSQYPTMSQVNAAVATATAPLLPSTTAASTYMTSPGVLGYIAAAAPGSCTAPLAETLNGAVGTGTPCLTRPDASPPTLVRAANSVTASGGAWTVTWSKAFASSTPVVNVLPVNTAGTTAIICNVQTRSTTVASGLCWSLQPTTLSLSIVTSGTTVQPAVTTASGIAVMVTGREPTQ